jgi:hypothetical protein
MSGKSELRIFDVNPPQIVVESAIFTDIHPTTSLIENHNNIEFFINGSQTEYLDLNDTMIYLKLNVTGKDRKILVAASTVTPANFFMNALFKDITLSLNDTVVEGGSQMFSYKSTIEDVFNFDDTSKKIQLLPKGFSDDEQIRKNWIKESRDLELVGALRLDFLNQPKYLIPGVNVRLTLTRNSDAFCLNSANGQPRINLIKAMLLVRRVKVSPSVQIGHITGMIKKNAIYPYTKSQVVSYSISQGSLSYFKENLFGSSVLPKFVVVAMTKSLAYTGNFKEDPFNFDHFNVNSVGLYRDGQAVPYRESYAPDFENDLYVCDYVKSMIHGVQHLNTNFTNGITLEKFANGGYTFFTFNLTPDFDITQAQLPQDGNLRLDIKFAKPLAQAINVIIYASFDAELQITNDRQILCDAH